MREVAENGRITEPVFLTPNATNERYVETARRITSDRGSGLKGKAKRCGNLHKVEGRRRLVRRRLNFSN